MRIKSGFEIGHLETIVPGGRGGERGGGKEREEEEGRR